MLNIFDIFELNIFVRIQILACPWTVPRESWRSRLCVRRPGPPAGIFISVEGECLPDPPIENMRACLWLDWHALRASSHDTGPGNAL